MTTHTQRGGFLPPNFTAVPNAIIDQLMGNLKGSELKIVLCICRKTIGWHRQTSDITKDQISEVTGLGMNTVDSALRELLDKKIVAVYSNPGRANTYEIISEIPPPKSGVGDYEPPLKSGVPPPPKTGVGDLYNKINNKESVRSGATDAPASLSRYLFDAIKKSDPAHKYNRSRPALLRWADDLRKALDIDGRTSTELKFVIDYIFTRDSEVAAFWQPSIQSGESLRANFDTIRGQIKREREKTGEQKEFDIGEANRIFMENFSGSNGSGTPFETVFKHCKGSGKDKKFTLNPAYKSHVTKW